MVRHTLNLLTIASALSFIACGDSHGLSDAGNDAAVDSGGLPDTGVEDTGVDDAGTPLDAGDDAGADAGPEELRLHVTVWADAEGTEAAIDTAWIAVGADGSRETGRTTVDGQVNLNLPASGTPYEWTVAAAGRGARSLVGLSGEVEAEVRLHATATALSPSEGRSVRVTVSGLADSESAAISGSGFFGTEWTDTTLEGVWDPGSSVYSLVAVVYEQRYVWLEELGSSHPVGPGGSPPVRAQVIIAPTTDIPPGAELVVDLSDGVSPVSHEVTIELPSRGYFRPSVHYVDGFWGLRRSPGPFLSHFVPFGANEITPSGDGGLRGLVYAFDEPELRWVEGWVWLRDSRADMLAEIRVDPELSAIVVPPVEGPVQVEGDTFAMLRFETNAPAWSSSRYGVQQWLGTEPGSPVVSWIVVAPTGRVVADALPTLPDGLDAEAIGFDNTRAANAFVENTHDLTEGAPLRDVPQVPYVNGQAASEGPARFVRRISW